MTPVIKAVKAPTIPVAVCTLAAHAYLEADGDRLTVLRQNPAPAERPFPLPPALLKHADEQTVLSLAAVLHALPQLPARDFSRWAILAAPRFVGRQMFVVGLRKFLDEGAWGVSPHLIPHRSLHSVSGTISQALKMHGPNYGVGNGPLSAGEGLLAAVAMTTRAQAPGVWFVMSSWSPEPTGAVSGVAESPVGAARCRALALALVAADPTPRQRQLSVRYEPMDVERPMWRRRTTQLPPLSLESLAAALEQNVGADAVAFSLPGGGRLQLESPRERTGEIVR